MSTLFWLAACFILYTYGGYPLLVALQARLFPRPVDRREHLPTVTVIVAASNEEATIAGRLENLLAQDYPPDRYRIVVVSDGSTDRTEEIARRYTGRSVELVSVKERVGKAAALNLGLAQAASEVVVFADARQRFIPDTVRQLTANFADPEVGCVSGELVLVDRGESQVEMALYWRFEKLIRRWESMSGSVVGATGAIYAIRRDLYRPLPPGTLLDDVLVPLNVAAAGYRVIFDPHPKAFDQLSLAIEQEWVRKVRTLAGSLQLLGFYPPLCTPWGSPLWWRFLSHKVFRVLIPFALVAMLAGSWLAKGTFYHAAFWFQFLGYLLALGGYLVPPLRALRPVRLALFFMTLNLAAVAACWIWASGRCETSWRPAYDKEEP
ncbi:glycosyltransferase family 2 protein [Geomonas sp. Red32]|uniref:glycosyltransferase family 2 protein n=1 Tax=Geomonas sp. Red32 TaxID=2912856 RepID=UPI00202CFE49|nr:glycosyltransferase family 2 protein [Geomonas sp. Red32]MCM0083339.1 glycosyltransferase family 2 protein [Geomonas sp. Red32]